MWADGLLRVGFGIIASLLKDPIDEPNSISLTV